MNDEDRKVWSAIYDCVNTITGMYPSNPADLKAKAIYLDGINNASSELLYALSNWQEGNYRRAKERTADARNILKACKQKRVKEVEG